MEATIHVSDCKTITVEHFTSTPGVEGCKIRYSHLGIRIGDNEISLFLARDTDALRIAEGIIDAVDNGTATVELTA